MTWVRVDDAFMDNPKVLSCNPVAIALYMAGLCYCSRNLTDGEIPERAVDKLLNFGGVTVDYDGRLCDGPSPVQMQIDELLSAGLWVRLEKGGYEVHDYLDYQPSASQVRHQRAELSEKRAVAGRLGGRPPSIKEANGKQDESKVKPPYPIPTPGPGPETSKPDVPDPQSRGSPARKTRAAALAEQITEPFVQAMTERWGGYFGGEQGIRDNISLCLSNAVKKGYTDGPACVRNWLSGDRRVLNAQAQERRDADRANGHAARGAQGDHPEPGGGRFARYNDGRADMPGVSEQGVAPP